MRRFAVVAMLVSVVALPAEAGRIEDAFRGFIERLKGGGQSIGEFRQSLGFVEVQVPELAPRVDKLPLGRQEYAVFVTPGCRGCEAAIRYLKSKKLSYEVMEVQRSSVAREAYTLTEGKGFPLILIGTQRLTGWNERLFKDALRNDVQDTLLRQQGDGA